jgi:chromosome segregation ATPase
MTNTDAHDTPEKAHARLSLRWQDQMERDRARAAAEAATRAAAQEARYDPDKIAKDLAQTDARLKQLREGLKATDDQIAGLEAKIESLPPREKPAAEDQLSILKKSRQAMRETIVQAEEHQIAARNNYRAAQRDVAGRVEEVVSQVNTSAKAFDDAGRAQAEAYQTIQDLARPLEVLGISIRSYLKPSAVQDALHAAGLAEALGLAPGRAAQTLEKSVEGFGTNARMRRAEVKKTKE